MKQDTSVLNVKDRTQCPMDLENQFAVEWREKICTETTDVCTRSFSKSLRAIVLTGSLARDEGTFVEDNGATMLLGDVDFFLIFNRREALPKAATVQAAANEIGMRLGQRGLLCKVGLEAVSPRFFRKLPADIATYELRKCGNVIWGDQAALSLIPACAPFQIRQEDAWQTLNNRLIEMVDNVRSLTPEARELAPALQYATTKLYLDMATSYLVFAGGYAPSYRERAAHLLKISAEQPADAPFPLGKFARRVASCTAWKLSGAKRHCDSSIEFWKDAIRYARKLWCWELAQLTKSSERQTSEMLFRRLAAAQGVAPRFRGWLSIMKRCGGVRSWRRWPHWVRLSFRASPRYLIYYVSAEVTFCLPCLIWGEATLPRLNPNYRCLENLLPEANPAAGHGMPPWRKLADDVIWNYSRFLIGTRA